MQLSVLIPRCTLKWSLNCCRESVHRWAFRVFLLPLYQLYHSGLHNVMWWWSSSAKNNNVPMWGKGANGRGIVSKGTLTTLVG
jgi:hypothetical protein